jgi:hypothetical protein
MLVIGEGRSKIEAGTGTSGKTLHLVKEIV